MILRGRREMTANIAYPLTKTGPAYALNTLYNKAVGVSRKGKSNFPQYIVHIQICSLG